MEDATFAPSGEGIKTIRAGGVVLVSVERPTSAEAQALERDFGLTRADFDLAIDRVAPASIIRRPDYVLLRASVPIVTPRSETLIATPVSFVVGRDFLLLVHRGEARALHRFFRQLETDEARRAEAGVGGVHALLCRCFECLLDAVDVAQARFERQVTESEERLARGEGWTDQDFSRLLRQRADARLIARLVVPLVTSVRQAAELGLPSEEWDRTLARAIRLAEVAADNRGAQDGLLLAHAVAMNARVVRLNRGLLAVAVLTLPALLAATVVSLVYGNMLGATDLRSAVALAVVGVVFVGALYVLRRQSIL